MTDIHQITAYLNYIDTEYITSQKDDKETPCKPGEYYEYQPFGEEDKLICECTGASATRKVVIHDGRFLTSDALPKINGHGFELISDNLGPIVSKLYDAPNLSIEYSELYVNGIEKLVKDVIEKRLNLRVKFASVFDLAKRKSRSSNNNEIPLSFIHSDYTRSSGIERLQQQVTSIKDALAPVSFKPLKNRFRNGEELEKYSHGKGRFLIVNVWRNADPSCLPIVQDPLAVCDPRSVPNESLVNYEIRCSNDLSLFEYHISGGKSDDDCKNHKWYYYSNMSVNECLMWISYDKDGKFLSVPHTAFSLPTEASRERKSIEARLFVFLE